MHISSYMDAYELLHLQVNPLLHIYIYMLAPTSSWRYNTKKVSTYFLTNCIHFMELGMLFYGTSGDTKSI